MKNGILFLLFCILFANIKVLNASEFVEPDLNYGEALKKLSGGYSGIQSAYDTFHKIALNPNHPNRLEAALELLEYEGRTATYPYDSVVSNKAKYKKAGRMALRDIATNDRNPWKQCRAAGTLYETFGGPSEEDKEPLRVIVRNVEHPERSQAAKKILDAIKISLDAAQDEALALDALRQVAATIDHKDRFYAAEVLWDAWGFKEEKESLKDHFIPVFVDVAQDPNGSNRFEASSKLLHLYKHGKNVNEAHKSIALEGLRRTIDNRFDPKRDNAAMYLGNTVIVSEYNRVGESKVGLAADLSLSYGLLYVSAEDEENPNQLSVLYWLCRNAPQELRDSFYGILKGLAERDIAGITDGHLVEKISKAGKLLSKIDKLNNPAI